MKKINFYIDENSLAQKLINIQQENDNINTIVATMELIYEADVCSLFASPNFYSIFINNKTIGEIVYAQEQNGEFRDTLVRLSIALEKADACDAEDQTLSSGIASLLKNGLGALISTSDCTPSQQWNSEKMIRVRSPQCVKLALRHLYTVAKIPEDLFARYCNHMFDNLYFHAQPKDINTIGLRYEDIIGKVIKHFSYLNDDAIKDFDNHTQPHQIIQQARANGVEISPESSNTHRDKKAMKARKISIEGYDLCCEWHTKIEPHYGRIHFYAQRARHEKIKEITQEKVIIGIITRHLK